MTPVYGHARQQEVVMKAGLVNSVLRAASVAAIPLALAAVSTPASAQRSAQRQLFEWRGNVDQEVRVQMQGNRAAVMAMWPRETTSSHNERAIRPTQPLPRSLTIKMPEARGNPDVDAQPRAQNQYKT